MDPIVYQRTKRRAVVIEIEILQGVGMANSATYEA